LFQCGTTYANLTTQEHQHSKWQKTKSAHKLHFSRCDPGLPQIRAIDHFSHGKPEAVAKKLRSTFAHLHTRSAQRLCAKTQVLLHDIQVRSLPGNSKGYLGTQPTNFCQVRHLRPEKLCLLSTEAEQMPFINKVSKNLGVLHLSANTDPRPYSCRLSAPIHGNLVLILSPPTGTPNLVKPTGKQFPHHNRGGHLHESKILGQLENLDPKPFVMGH
jgi:hypothetical protein